jgi:hypothetical protein
LEDDESKQRRRELHGAKGFAEALQT